MVCGERFFFPYDYHCLPVISNQCNSSIMFSSNTFLEIFHSLTNKRKEILQHGWIGSFFFDIYDSEGKETACNAGDAGDVGLITRWQDPLELMGFTCDLAGKESTCKAGYLGSIPGLGRSPGEGKGYPLQYSGLENSLDCIVHGVTKSQAWLSDFHFHFQSV